MAPRLAPFAWRDLTHVQVVPGVLAALVVLALAYAWAQHRVPGWPARCWPSRPPWTWPQRSRRPCGPPSTRRLDAS